MSVLHKDFLSAISGLIDADQYEKDFIEKEHPGFIREHEYLVSKNSQYSALFNKFSTHVQKCDDTMKNLVEKDESGSVISTIFAFVTAYPIIELAKIKMRNTSNKMYEIYKFNEF